MSPYIREATPDDIHAIRSLAHEVWPKTYSNIISQEQLFYMLEWMYSPESLMHQMQSGTRFLLAEDEANYLLGFAAFKYMEGTGWKLEKLYVQSDRQQRGVGKHLIEKVKAEIKTLHGKSLELQVNRQNPAVFFYQKIGFQILRTEDFDIGNGFYMNDYIMGIVI